MKKIFLFTVVFASVISFASCSSNKVNGSELIQEMSEQKIDVDSVARMYIKNFMNLHIYTTSNIAENHISLTDGIAKTFINDVYPEIQKFYRENMDDFNTYESIELYAGTDGEKWIIHEKFRAGGKIKYFYYNNGEKSFVDKNNYVDDWMNLVEVSIYSDIERKVPTPSELDDLIFNEGQCVLTYALTAKGLNYFHYNNVEYLFLDGKLKEVV